MGLFGSFLSKFSRSSVSVEDIEEFRSLLISSDIGPRYTEELLELVKKSKPEELSEKIKDQILASLTEKERTLTRPQAHALMTILIVGVNGTGKTTSAAKLAQLLKSSGEKVILAAADTFRAAAVDQLKTWADRISIPVVTGAVNADPASVAFDAASRAKAEGCTVLIIDTAGRLHTKSNLMDELSKIRRVVEKVTPITETLFVLDGTTGQNGITQARTFSESTNLTGIIVTKVDGSTKGGIALATERELGIPIKYIGTGESINDLSPFDAEGFVAALVTEP